MLRCESAPQPPGYTDRSLAPVAQGIERCPAEAEVASSNLAGRMASLAVIIPASTAVFLQAHDSSRRFSVG